MATKFTDKLAQQTLADALDTHDRLIRNQAELQAARDALVADIARIESEVEQLADRPYHSGAASLAEIEARTLEQETRRNDLQQQLDTARRKLRLVNASRTKTGGDLSLASTAVKEGRLALAASLERHSRKDIEAAIGALNSVRAVWDEALEGAFDFSHWASDLLYDHRPTEAQEQAARALLGTEDA